MLSEKSRTILVQQVIELEKEIEQLTKAKEELVGILDTKPTKSACEDVVRTGKYWYRNRFVPEQGFATSLGFRILYELQDEGPNFIGVAEGKDLSFDNIKEAREYVRKRQDSGTIYTIISPDGEIVL